MESGGSRLHEHLEKLRHFVSTAETGSFSSAATVLRVSQPAISHSIKILEEVLGTALLLRTSRGVQLTSAGEVLFSEGKKLLEQSCQIEATILRAKSSSLSLIEIGTKEPYAIHLFPNYLKHLEAALPDTAISLTIRRSNEELVQMLIDESLEAILIPDPPPREELMAYKLSQDGYELFTAPVEPADRKSHPPTLYLFRQALCGGGNRVDEVLKTLPKSDLQIKDVGSFEAARAMAVNGMGLALLPRLSVQGDLKAKRLKKITRKDFPMESFGTLNICLCLHAKNAKESAYREFIRAFLELKDSALHIGLRIS